MIKDSLLGRLEALNELIYEPEERMPAFQRNRLIAQRDELHAEIERCEGDIVECDRCGKVLPKPEVVTTAGRCGYGDFCFDCALLIDDGMPRSW